MDCAKAKEYLGPYIDEALPAQYVRELEQHLQGCTDCAFELAQLRALSAALRSLPPAELPPGFTAAFREKLAAEPKPKPVPVPQRGWARVLAAAALLVLVAGVVSLWGNVNRARNYGGLAPAAAPEMVMSMTVASEPWMAPAPSAPPSIYMAGGAPATEDYDIGVLDDLVYDINYEEESLKSANASGIAVREGAVTAHDASEEAEAQLMPGGDGAAGLYTKQRLERKIIRDASLSVRVDDFSAAYQSLNELAARYGGYVVSGDAASYGGEEMQRGNITLRVEAGRLDEALAEIEALGKVENRNIYTQDVTMEYYDVAGRLTQYQTQEKRLLAILDKAETVEDLVTVERELTRVRAQLESLTGQLRYFDQMTALSCINIHLYQPDAATQTVRLGGWAGLMQDIREGFIVGVNRLIRGTYGLVVGFARLLPPFLLLAAAAIVVIVLIKRRRRR